VKVVIDTNVLVSAFIARGASLDVFEQVCRAHELIGSEAILVEFRRVLTGKLGFPAALVARAVSNLKKQMTLVVPSPLDTPICRDPDDDEILATALAGDADCIVTGDDDLLVLGEVRGIPILRPGSFWRFESERGS